MASTWIILFGSSPKQQGVAEKSSRTGVQIKMEDNQWVRYRNLPSKVLPALATNKLKVLFFVTVPIKESFVKRMRFSSLFSWDQGKEF